MKKKIVFISIIVAIIIVASVFLYNTYATDPVPANDSYAITLTGDTTVTLAANEKKNFIYQIKNTNNGTVNYGIGYSSTNSSATVKIWNDSTDPATGTISANNYKYVKLRIENRTTTPDTVTLSTILGYENGGDLPTPSGTTIVTEVYTPPITAAQYITNLYNNAEKTVVTNNNIEYNYATSEYLMNDRLGGTTESLDGGDIRYYGASNVVNNYVWLGDTYISSFEFTSNGKIITRNVGDKKLWRIIGVFDGRLKLVTADPISATNLSWDTSERAVNTGYGINQWGPSPIDGSGYQGADLMKLLNPGYEGESVNNSLYWNKGTGTVYTGTSNVIKEKVSFASTGLSIQEQEMIDVITWYFGAYNLANSYSNELYAKERRDTNTASYSDGVERTLSWDGKVGLIYPSDYGYATDFTSCNLIVSNYNNSNNSYACRVKNWLFNSSYGKWTISPRKYNGEPWVFYVNKDGAVRQSQTGSGETARAYPVIFLKAEVSLISGEGTDTEPYELSLD